MPIDLSNKESRQGAIDALKTILKSKKAPILVTPGPVGGGGGPQLQPPRNVKVRPQGPQGGPQPQPQQPQKGPEDDPKGPQNNPVKPGQPQGPQGGQQGGQQGPQNGPQGQGGQGGGQQGPTGNGTGNGGGNGSGGGEEEKEKGKGQGEKEPTDPLDELDDSETDEERKDRLERIKQDMDPETIAQDLDDIKRDTNIRQGEIMKAKQDALDALTRETQGGNLSSFSSFSVDLFKAINSQVKQAKHKDDT